VTLILDLWPWLSNSSERGTRHVFFVNLAQIRSAVPEIFHTQTKNHRLAGSDDAKNRNWKREWMPSASKLFTDLFYMWCKYDVTVMFMTMMNCASVCCMCGEAWSSRLLMTQLTNGQHACVVVFVPMMDILNIPCELWPSFCFLCTWWTFCFRPRLTQWVIF